MIDWLPILIFPTCALVAVAVIALVQRGEELDDRGLLLSFALLFSMALLLALGLLQTRWVQGKLDPTIELAEQLEAHPLVRALAEFHGDDDLLLRTAMLAQMDKGMPLPQVLQSARPAFARVGQDRLGFADAAAHVAWGKAELGALRELQVVDVKRCATLALSQGSPESFAALASGISSDNQREFEAAFVAVMTSADAGMRRTGPPRDQTLDFNQVQQRYMQIHEPLEQRHGSSVADFLAKRRWESVPAFDDARVLCDFRIAQLDAYLREPPEMAARLLDSAMR